MLKCVVTLTYINYHGNFTTELRCGLFIESLYIITSDIVLIPKQDYDHVGK